MKLSQNFSKTTKDIPKDETSLNAQLLIKAGFVHKTMAGVYSYLPLGLRVLGNIENIVREHMNAIGGQEVLLNSLHPKQWWDQTGRWDEVDVLFKLKSQTENEYGLAPTHEEQISPLIKQYINSHKDLPDFDEQAGRYPLSVYQIQTKFRDELRSKAGLMRGREFRMKDMYDFHKNRESQASYFELVTTTYLNIFEEIGLEAYAVDASGGDFSDKFSREFQVACRAGEDTIVITANGKHAYNKEVAPAKISYVHPQEEMKPKEDIEAQGIIGVQALLDHLGIGIQKSTKTLFYECEDGQVIGACLLATHNVNVEKLQKLAPSKIKGLASETTIESLTGAKVGYAGIVNLPDAITMYYDDSLEGLTNFECGTNRSGYHSLNVNFGRDLPIPEQWYDIKEAKEGDIHPASGEEYIEHISAEVGNIFDLCDKWTKAFEITYTDENNEQQYPTMGCHGIGTSRCLGVIAENNNDDKGLIWPESIAPFKYHLVSHFNPKDEQTKDKVLAIARDIYNARHKLKGLDISEGEILWDERPVGMGQKLGDADLIGCPWQIIISPRTLDQGCVELKNRRTLESTNIPL